MGSAHNTLQGCQAVLNDLLEAAPEYIGRQDVALLNLLCAPTLPGSENLDIPGCLARLDRLTAYVKEATEKYLPTYRQDPDYGYSEPIWRMAKLITKVKRDYGATYDPGVTTDLEAKRDSPFVDSRNVFIHGLLDKDPKRRWGSCTSMPVLIVAVARRLGYPVRLAAAPQHFYARWDDGQGTAFNIESSGPGGLSFFPDDYYRHWPTEITPEEENSGHFLRSFTPDEEFAAFLQTRVWCLADTARYGNTFLWSARAMQFAPDAHHFIKFALMVANTALKQRYRQKYPDRAIPPERSKEKFVCNFGELVTVPERALYLTIRGHNEEIMGELDPARESFEDACRQDRWGNSVQRDLQRFLRKYDLKPRTGRLLPPQNLGQTRHIRLNCPPEQEAPLLLRMAVDAAQHGRLLEAYYALQDLYLFDPCNAEIFERMQAIRRHPQCQAGLREVVHTKTQARVMGQIEDLMHQARVGIKGPLNIVNERRLDLNL